jgi:hypothetical protein
MDRFTQVPGRYEARLRPETVEQLPKPVDLAGVLMMHMAYVFAGVPAEFHEADSEVPVYNFDELVGHISYIRGEEGEVDVVIVDAPNSQGNILTSAAKSLTKKPE